MMSESIELQNVLDTFEDLWSPRIVTQFNDYDVRVAKFGGEYIWHAHEDTDEFFLVVDGTLTIWLRENDEERSVTLPKGAVFVVPKGMEHKPVASDGASILMIEPTGTLTVGDRHEDVPDYIDATTGHRLA
ncbi:cupin domain-containing protein [Streptomyces sp. NBC_01410]|uniref:cupin domain-containing protein n=1 Tax=Streptomyces sp. NBC_01410 TaxID=2903856 RepID=UPI003243234F